VRGLTVKKLLVLWVSLMFLAPLVALAAPAPFDGVYGSGPDKFTLATGSPGELGLVKALAEGFDKAMQGKISLQ
jgi:tungstate transport system substrate-binding protein